MVTRELDAPDALGRSELLPLAGIETDPSGSAPAEGDRDTTQEARTPSPDPPFHPEAAGALSP